MAKDNSSRPGDMQLHLSTRGGAKKEIRGEVLTMANQEIMLCYSLLGFKYPTVPKTGAIP